MVPARPACCGCKHENFLSRKTTVRFKLNLKTDGPDYKTIFKFGKHLESPVDAYTFAHVNDGNAVALPFAKGFGWGGELNLEYTFEKLFGFGHGQGYPKERVEPEQRNKKILDGVRAIAFRDLNDILKDLPRDLVKGALSGEHFAEYFFPACKDEKLAATVKELLA